MLRSSTTSSYSLRPDSGGTPSACVPTAKHWKSSAARCTPTITWIGCSGKSECTRRRPLVLRPPLGGMLAVLLEQKFFVRVDDVECRPPAHAPPVVEPHGAAADRRDEVERVRAEADRFPRLLELADFVDALFLKVARSEEHT